MTDRLMMSKKLNGAEGFDPNKNQRMDNREAGRTQPARPMARYSLEVSCSLKMTRSNRLTRVWPSVMRRRIPKIPCH